MIPEQSQRVMDLPLEKLHRLIQDLALWGKQKQPCDHILLWHTASWWEAVLCTRSLQAIQEIFLSEKRFCFPYLHTAESIRQLGRPAKLPNTFRSHTYLYLKNQPWKIHMQLEKTWENFECARPLVSQPSHKIKPLLCQSGMIPISVSWGFC